MMKLSNVTKVYNDQAALNEIEITLPTGKIIGIIGANGSGKSTILKVMAGLVKPTRGSATFNGVEIDRSISKSVAYLSELDAYYPFYTVIETIEFFASQFSDFDLTKARKIMDFMQLDPNKKVSELSKGNRGRLKMVLILARRVPVILMDEPLSGLDPMVRETIIKGLISFIDIEEQTVVITTHEINEIEPLLDSVIVLRDGSIVAEADVEDIRQTKNISVVDWLKTIYKS